VNGSPLVVGFLITQTPDVHLRAIQSIKLLTGYRGRVAYRTTGSYKVGCARELIHYFVRNPDLRFLARVVESPRAADFKPEGVRITQYQELFKTADLPVGSILRMKRRRREWGWTNVHPRYGDEQHASRVDALVASKLILRGEAITRAANDGLVELSNLLTGTLFGGWPRREAGHAPHPVKAVILARLSALLDVRGVDQPVKGKWEPTATSLRGDGRAR
jgi:hypothetical protein